MAGVDNIRDLPDPVNQLEGFESFAKALPSWQAWGRWDQRRGPEAESRPWLEQIESIVDATLTNLVADSEPDDILKAIKKRRDNLAMPSRIEDQIVSTCRHILTFGVAGLAAIVVFANRIPSLQEPLRRVLAIIGIFYGELVVASFFVLCYHMLQARFRFPFLYFKRIGNTWPWFYSGSITPVSRVPLPFQRKQFEAALSYAKDLIRFAARCVREDKKAQLKNELLQYFLLISYQGYTDQFQIRLTNLFLYCVAGAFLSTGFLGILIWLDVVKAR